MRVLIVGAGLGGLCLAHGLRQAGIDTAVLERRPSPAAQPASYGIHLNADGLHALHSCLPETNWRHLADAAAPARDLLRFLDTDLRTLAIKDNEQSAANLDPVTRRRAVRRETLRDALLLGLNTTTRGDRDPIQWGKQFDRYDQLADGRVQVHCVDGSAYTADVVVGADASNSRVRAQRLPDLRRQDLGILNIAGRVPLTPELRGRVPATLIDGAVNNIVPVRPGWLFVSTWNGGPHDDAAEFAVWAWAAQRDSYPGNVDTFTDSELHRLVTDNVTGWSQPLRDLVSATNPDTVSAVPLRTMPTLPAWQPTPVTLLGDAVHNMTPMAGIGANTALRDADELRRALTASGGTLIDRIGAYEIRMRDYANHALALSTRNARNAASPARLPRLAFRTVLRVAEAVPPVKRKMFGGSPGQTA